ncbi:hypothetical protein PhCBS80983_g01450 [Powellomyces hirtus]|uniref:Asparagine synthetase domain-containing protein n=1 Tax=Powellomyces hirtus TaxID=109895 RepID=A0A507EC97_9FUNG|nr:hypothetical protein PhCBS80983_g01450 [Powellomyces hirtus]
MSPRAPELRSTLLSVCDSHNGTVDCILLSGGLDTSIFADAGHEILGLKTAVTVVCGQNQPDEPYATAIAAKRGLDHHIVRLSSPMELVTEGDILNLCVRTLFTFDPMELRNAVVIAKGLLKCKALGAKSIVTGDGADELFAGYSFMKSMSPGRLKRYIGRLAVPGVMRFCAGPLGKELGLTVVQPFLDEKVVAIAVKCPKSALLRETEDGVVHGKYLLREAFPEALSQWRKKDPIEVGSGTSILPKIFAERSNDKLFAAEVQSILEKDQVKIRDPEHLHYYRVFKNTFAIERRDQFFCVVCGEWPAREGSLPTDVQDGDDVDQ